MGNYYERGMLSLNLRHHRSRAWAWALAAGFTIFFGLLLLFQPRGILPRPFQQVADPPSIPPASIYHTEPPYINQHARESLGPCVGPRGLNIHDINTQDLPHPVSDLPNVTYPEPTYGSYKELGLPQTWMTFSQRYGPFGYGEDVDSYQWDKVDWNRVNWARLQDQCLDSTSTGFSAQTGSPPRFRLYGDGDLEIDRRAINGTGRHAIVLRTWSTYKYMPEDYWNLRSIISEAGLAGDGQFTVFLLVDVKHPNGSRIHEDDAYYQQILVESVPQEFREIAVLFHKSLQESWYPKVKEYQPIWQIMQPLQLFAHFYPEFDHYWQFEMDTRFTGEVGKMLSKYHDFGKQVPYKQSRERASWTYMPAVHGTYAEFAAGINEALDGDATVWGPVRIDEIPEPQGRLPPMAAIDDNFDFGVGWEADLLLYSPMFEVNRFKKLDDWVFKDWVFGFSDKNVPRFSNAPAQARASRGLLEAIHTSQREKGLRVPAEATLPSFAMWHGMKIVQVPIPKFQFPTRPTRELNVIHNGGPLTKFKDGIAFGAAPYQKSVIEWYSRPRTWEWQSSLIKPIFDYWMGVKKVGEEHHQNKKRAGVPAALGEVPDVLPPFMVEVDGEVYCPGLMLHPRKTNAAPASS